DSALSPAEFYLAASVFSERWSKFNSSFPPWEWRRSPISLDPEEGYLALESAIVPKSEANRLEADDNSDAEESCSSALADEFNDETVFVHDDEIGRHHYDLHIVHSASYLVPVLFFRAYRPDGQPLLLDEIKADLDAESARRLEEAPWMFITQEEHPLLNRPWFTVHPCGTREWMKLLLSHGNKIQSYFTSWFSVVGQLFGFRIPLQMA
ncbi:hypothetical protein M569_15174, partial [Genlisea aurea]